MGDRAFLRFTVSESRTVRGYVLFEEMAESFDSLTDLYRVPLFWIGDDAVARQLANEMNEGLGGELTDEIADKREEEIPFEKRRNALEFLMYRRNLPDSTIVFLKSFHDHPHFHDKHVMESILNLMAGMPPTSYKWYKRGCIRSGHEREIPISSPR